MSSVESHGAQDALNESAQGAPKEPEKLRLLLGAVDVGLEQAGCALRAARGLLVRSDLGEMAAGYRAELVARGDALLGRLRQPAEPHLEVLARRVPPVERGVDVRY